MKDPATLDMPKAAGLSTVNHAPAIGDRQVQMFGAQYNKVSSPEYGSPTLLVQ